MNSSGKVLIIFLVITAILLVSLTAISLFFFQKETERRKLVEATLEELQSEKTKIDEDLKEIKKQNFLLQEKNKEADARVNDLTDELELEKGLREEMKLETVALEEKLKEMEAEKGKFAKQIEDREALQEKLSQDLSVSEQKIKKLEAELKAEVERSQKLGKLYEEKQKEEISKKKESLSQQQATTQQNAFTEKGAEDGVNMGVELQEIVIGPGTSQVNNNTPEIFFKEPTEALKSALNGQILSVDVETEFVIVNLGEKDGLAVGHVLSVYRNDDYVGDIKITRLQSEMSAADLILPLSIRNVRKNDQVKTK